MVEAIVVSVAGVSIPVLRHDLKRHVGEEAIHVEQGIHACVPLSGVRESAGSRQCVEVLPVRRLLAGVELEVLVNVPQEASVVEVAGGIGVVAGKEGTVEALFQHVEPEVPAIEREQGVRRARRRDAGPAVQVAADQLGHAAGILHRVVEVELVEPKDLLAGHELVGVQGEGRVFVDAPGGAGRALHAHADALPGVGSNAEGGGNGLSGLAAEGVQLGRGDGHIEAQDGALEDLVRWVGLEVGGVQRRGRGHGNPSQPRGTQEPCAGPR